MAFELKNDRPIYLQLMEILTQRITAGIYTPGSQLPSVRDLALEFSVNPNTMQRSLSELERGGLIYTMRTTGRFVTEDMGKIRASKMQRGEEEVRLFLERMHQTGFDGEEIRSLLRRAITEEDL